MGAVVCRTASSFHQFHTRAIFIWPCTWRSTRCAKHARSHVTVLTPVGLLLSFDGSLNFWCHELLLFYLYCQCDNPLVQMPTFQTNMTSNPGAGIYSHSVTITFIPVKLPWDKINRFEWSLSICCICKVRSHRMCCATGNRSQCIHSMDQVKVVYIYTFYTSNHGMYTRKFKHSGCLHRNNLNMLCWKRLVHRDLYFIVDVSIRPSWATLLKANKLDTSLSVGWIRAASIGQCVCWAQYANTYDQLGSCFYLKFTGDVSSWYLFTWYDLTFYTAYTHVKTNYPLGLPIPVSYFSTKQTNKWINL